MKTTIRQSIKTALNTIRETRKNRAVPCLLGAGFTIAIAGTSNCINPNGNFDGKAGMNFSGTWNRETVYFPREKAESLLKRIAPVYAGKLALEIVHHNELRDRSENTALDMLKTLLPIRNHA